MIRNPLSGFFLENDIFLENEVSGHLGCDGRGIVTSRADVLRPSVLIALGAGESPLGLAEAWSWTAMMKLWKALRATTMIAFLLVGTSLRFAPV